MPDVSGWVKRWSHWSNSWAREYRIVGICGMTYVRFYEEENCQRRVTSYVFNYEDKGRANALKFSMDHFKFGRPFDKHWSICRHENFYSDLGLETRFRYGTSLGSVFIGWNNLEAF